MGVARNLAPHGAQAEPFGGVIGGGLDAAIVQHDRFGPFAFKEKLAVIGPGRGVAQDRQRCPFVQCRLEGAEGGIGHGGCP